MAAGSVHIPWYATAFRGDDLEAALNDIAAIAPRYGAIDYAVYRSRDDRYKFLQVVGFQTKDDWERYWYGDDFSDWRARYSGWYQVPVLYVWHDVTAQGAVAPQPASANSD